MDARTNSLTEISRTERGKTQLTSNTVLTYSTIAGDKFHFKILK